MKYFSFDSYNILICIDLTVDCNKNRISIIQYWNEEIDWRCCFNHLADLHKKVNLGQCVCVAVRWLLPDVCIKLINSPVINFADE